jgi:lysozyme
VADLGCFEAWEHQARARHMLCIDEGVKHYAYRCPAGFLTIGVGHNLDAKGVSDQAIKAMLDDDIDDARDAAIRCFGEVQFGAFSVFRQMAILNMIFNLGEQGFLKFAETIELMKARRWVDAAARIAKTPYATQVGDRARRVCMMLRDEGFPY